MFWKQALNILDVKTRFLKDKVQLLRDIVKRHVIRYPFQSITSFGAIKASIEKGRPVPGLRDFFSAIFKGGGGLCSHNNHVLRLHLESIGYETRTIAGCFRRTGFPNSHFVTLVRIAPPYSKDPKEEKLYLVDVGCGVPLYEPILLGDLPYRSRAGGLNFRYEKIDENNIQRVNENGDAIMGEKPAGYPSPQDYTVSMTPTTFEEILPQVTEIFTNINAVYIHHGPYCFRYLSITDSDFEIACIRGTELILITKETRTVQTFKDFYELRPAFEKYFPMIDPREVDQALINYSTPIGKMATS